MSVINNGRRKQQMGMAIYDDLAQQESQRNNANENIELAAKQAKDSTLATSAGMVASALPSAVAGAQASGAVMGGLAAAGPVGWVGLAGLAVGLFS